MTRRRRMHAAVAVTAGALCLTPATPALAWQPVPETGRNGLLTLHTSPSPLHFSRLEPGETAYGQVAAHMQTAHAAEVALGVRMSGPLADHPQGLSLSVTTCDVAWALDGSPGCASGERAVLTATPDQDYVSSSPLWDLGPLPVEGTRYLLLALTLAEGAPRDASASFAFEVRAEGDSGPPAENNSEQALPSRLAETGLGMLGLVLLSAGPLLLGALLRARSARSTDA